MRKACNKRKKLLSVMIKTAKLDNRLCYALGQWYKADKECFTDKKIKTIFNNANPLHGHVFYRLAGERCHQEMVRTFSRAGYFNNACRMLDGRCDKETFRAVILAIPRPPQSETRQRQHAFELILKALYNMKELEYPLEVDLFAKALSMHAGGDNLVLRLWKLFNECKLVMALHMYKDMLRCVRSVKLRLHILSTDGVRYDLEDYMYVLARDGYPNGYVTLEQFLMVIRQGREKGIRFPSKIYVFFFRLCRSVDQMLSILTAGKGQIVKEAYSFAIYKCDCVEDAARVVNLARDHEVRLEKELYEETLKLSRSFDEATCIVKLAKEDGVEVNIQEFVIEMMIKGGSELVQKCAGFLRETLSEDELDDALSEILSFILSQKVDYQVAVNLLKEITKENNQAFEKSSGVLIEGCFED